MTLKGWVPDEGDSLFEAIAEGNRRRAIAAQRVGDRRGGETVAQWLRRFNAALAEVNREEATPSELVEAERRAAGSTGT